MSLPSGTPAAAAGPAPWQHPIPRRDWPRRGALRLRLEADAEARGRIAAALGLIELPALTLALELRPAGGADLVLEGRLTAQAVQACSVTLDPVPCAIDEPVTRRYLADWTEPQAEETELDADTDAEPLPAAAIDAGAVAVEALALALPPWPRAPGADLGSLAAAPPGADPGEADSPRPFAGLAALKDRLGGPGAGGGAKG